MKKRQLFISIVLGVYLAALIPGVVMAAKPIDFLATGNVTVLEPVEYPDVFPAGNSGRWVVASRYLAGELVGDIPGSFAFTMTYTANVKLPEEAGNLHGTLKMNGYTLKVNGKTGAVAEDTIRISGHWTFIEGAKGHGEFEAELVFDTSTGELIPKLSLIQLTGEWQPEG